MWSDTFLKLRVTVCWSKVWLESGDGTLNGLTWRLPCSFILLSLCYQSLKHWFWWPGFLHKGWRRLVGLHNLIVHCCWREFWTDVKCILLTLVWNENVCSAHFYFFCESITEVKNLLFSVLRWRLYKTKQIRSIQFYLILKIFWCIQGAEIATFLDLLFKM